MSENGENGTGNGLEMTMEIAGNRSAIAVLKIESKLPFYDLESLKKDVLVWRYQILKIKIFKIIM